MNTSQLQTEIATIEKWFEEHDHALTTLNEMIHNWELTVPLFTKEYQGTLDEYMNDIAPRELIQIFCDKASNELKEYILAKVKNFDQEFLQNTLETEKLRDFAKKNNYSTWLYRKPKKLHQAFLDEFE